jgi:hypothetical protein
MTTEKCIHFWIVNDRGTRGTCKLCGKTVVYPERLTVVEYQQQRKEAHRQVVEAKKLTSDLIMDVRTRNLRLN